MDFCIQHNMQEEFAKISLSKAEGVFPIKLFLYVKAFHFIVSCPYWKNKQNSPIMLLQQLGLFFFFFLQKVLNTCHGKAQQEMLKCKTEQHGP